MLFPHPLRARCACRKTKPGGRRLRLPGNSSDIFLDSANAASKICRPGGFRAFALHGFPGSLSRRPRGYRPPLDLGRTPSATLQSVMRPKSSGPPRVHTLPQPRAAPPPNFFSSLSVVNKKNYAGPPENQNQFYAHTITCFCLDTKCLDMLLLSFYQRKNRD